MLFCNPYLFLSQILFFNKNLSFFDMQIKKLFLKVQRKTRYIYRKTIKKACFSINIQRVS
ncbi:hypothetical protein DW701_07805 [Bacteroides eggerthii]|uniref:Uncharacterized protein n=1 Tax=Bacteroides eggerthii TaxID=28111 RepID=A0A414MD88_9BACE|nr:hypothetical protein DWX01_01800 [Bacteroides eggerthii]RHB95719.1 hypothetical protein DW866_03105 [Bacteroides eggerthii]RHF09120.1 hypothetical protein DW701_07805 [Bacteroides eggerthii]RHH25507.1 hypothetical protein DW218_03035 [Bacteroides eggerthii]RHI75790.1 hypothetical protein DW157_04770 [Bacteroides eggerthii]